MENFKATLQVKKDHYNFVEGSCIHLYNQVKDILDLVEKKKIISPSVLIIGVGDNLLKIVLENKFKFRVKTIDIDSELNPDYVGSVDNIGNVVMEKFDIVVCAHVLEHLPFKYFNKSLEQIKAITDYSLLCLPIAKFGIIIGAGIYPLFFKKIYFISTYFFKKHKFDGQHYWEIGIRGHSKKKIRREIEKFFNIEKEYNPENWLYSYNFVLKSKK